MKLILKRIALRDTYTIGHLYIDSHYFCDTLEDRVRDINKDGDLNDVGRRPFLMEHIRLRHLYNLPSTANEHRMLGVRVIFLACSMCHTSRAYSYTLGTP